MPSSCARATSAAAARALRTGLEKYDRGLGVWRGTRKVIDPARLGSEADWRAALAETEVPRDIVGWYPAVVLEVGENTARIGIENVEDIIADLDQALAKATA